LKHEQAREQERLDRLDPLRPVDGERGGDARALGDAEPQAAEQPIEIELAVTDAREVRVAQEVVTPVYVEGPAHGARKEGDGMASAHQIDDALRKRGVEAHEDAMHLGRWVEHEPERPFLVPSGLRERLFEEVRE